MFNFSICQHDRVLDLRSGDLDVFADRRVGADIRIDQPSSTADHGRPANDRTLDPGTGLNHYPAVNCAVDQLAFDPWLKVFKNQTVRLQHVVKPAGVFPPALDDMWLDVLPLIDQVLNRIGDLELA